MRSAGRFGEPAAGVPGGGAGERGARAYAVPAALPRERPRPVPADDRHRVRLGGGRGLYLRHHPAAIDAAVLSARQRLGHGPELRRLPAVPDRHLARGHGGTGGGAGIHPLRRAGARGSRQPAHGARAGHRRRPRVRHHLRARRRARGSRRRARHRGGRARPRIRLHLSGLRADRSGGRRARLHRGPFLAASLLGISDMAGKYYFPELGAFLIYFVMVAL